MGGCAGVLIADRWFLTAAHCKLIRARAPDHMSVVINEHEIFTDVSAIGQQHPPSHQPPSHKSSYFFELTREHVNYCLCQTVFDGFCHPKGYPYPLTVNIFNQNIWRTWEVPPPLPFMDRKFAPTRTSRFASSPLGKSPGPREYKSQYIPPQGSVGLQCVEKCKCMTKTCVV